MKYAVNATVLVRGEATNADDKVTEAFTSPIQATIIDRMDAAGWQRTDQAPVTLGVFHKDNSANVIVAPTFGAVSRYGVVAETSSLEVVGVAAKRVADARAALRVVAGVDGADSTTTDGVYGEDAVPQPLKVGMLDGTAGVFMKQITAAEHQAANTTLQREGLTGWVALILSAGELASNMARFTGMCFGGARSAGFSSELKERILLGYLVTSGDHYAEYYEPAARARRLIVEELEEKLADYDVLVGSVDSLRDAACLAGLPTITIRTRNDVSLTMVGARGADEKLLTFAESLESIEMEEDV